MQTEGVRIGFQFIWPGCGYGGAKGLAGRRFALWGLAFKPNTRGHGGCASVAAYAPKAAEEADALVFCTEWKRFMAPNFDQLAATLPTS